MRIYQKSTRYKSLMTLNQDSPKMKKEEKQLIKRFQNIYMLPNSRYEYA